MTDNVLKLSESMLKTLYDNCPEGGVVNLVWHGEDFAGAVKPFRIEREFRLVPFEEEE